MKILVLGAGVTGLTAAYELQKLSRAKGKSLEVTVLEASRRPGGKILTENRQGFVLESGPDSFVTIRPQALELARELGLDDELLPTRGKGAVYVYAGGRLRRLPSGMELMVPTRFFPFLFSDLLSWRGKLRAAMEPFVPPLTGALDESLADFVRRRLGPEVLEKVAAPLLAGIYAADPELMSLQSTFPQFKKMESEGGLLRSALARKRSPLPRGQTLFMSLKGGLSRLSEALAAKLEPGVLRLGSPVQRLERRGEAWTAVTPGGRLEAQSVVSALPAPALAEAVSDLDGELAAVLREIPFSSTATVSLAYRSQDIPALKGFGFLVARGESKTIAAATYTSSKFADRAPEGKVLVRCFIGGAGREEAALSSESRLADRTAAELASILGLGKAEPELVKVSRWAKANPQYNVGHGLRLERMRSCLKGHPGLFPAGSSYDGVGLPDCVLSGRRAAQAAFESAASGRVAA